MFDNNLFFDFLSLYRAFGFFLTICFLGIFWVFITELNGRGFISRILGSLFWFTIIAPFSSLIYFYLLKLEKDRKRDQQREEELKKTT